MGVKIERLKKYTAVIVILVLTASVLSGCGLLESKKKTVVTVLFNTKFDLLEQLIEKVYPDIDLQAEQSFNPGEQLRRLENGVGPDLVITTQPLTGESLDYVLDISDMSVTVAYDGAVMKNLKQDGKIYQLPLPGQYTGYIVNETLFELEEISVPNTNEELREALITLKERGIAGEDGSNFAVFSDYNANIAMFYTGYTVPDFLGTMEGVNWLAALWTQNASFSGVWEESFTAIGKLAEAGVIDAAAIGRQRNSIKYSARMGRGTLAVLCGDSALFSECVAENLNAVEAGEAPVYSYRMLPFLSNGENSPWVLFSPAAYIGINSSSGKEKQEACRRVLELLSTQEGQEALIQELNTGISCLQNYEAGEDTVPKGIESCIENGYVYHVLFPERTLEYLGSNARKVMGNKITISEALASLDYYVREGADSVDDAMEVVGVMEEDLLLHDFNVRRGESEIGNFLADSVADASGAPIAVINGGGIRSSFYKGEVLGEDLEAVCPFDNLIVVLEMDGQTMWDMIENGLTVCTDELPGGRFLSVSGLTYVFDSSRPAGERLMELTLRDGTPVDRKTVYQVAINDYMAGKRGYVEGNGDNDTMLNWYDDETEKGSVSMVKETGLTYRDAMVLYFDNHQGSPVRAQIEGRITDLADNKMK